MAIRLPLMTVLSVSNAGEDGTNSVVGGIAHEFTVPQDTDNIVVKFRASTVGGGASAFLQTTDDGGTTWYDVARTSVVSNANGVRAQWISAPVISAGQATGVNKANSIISAGIGLAAPSTLGSQQNSGLPILGQLNRVFVTLTGDVSGGTVLATEVKVNSQSATA